MLDLMRSQLGHLIALGAAVVVVVHANRFTRFNLSAGHSLGSPSYGSLGSQTLVELTTNTR
jgi:hypothetical protein